MHMDHGEIKGGGLLLILSDPYSGWPEAIQVTSRTTSVVMKVLRAVFARNGVPKTLVCDNAAEFKAEELKNWLSRIGCKMVYTPPYFPQSNGQAERTVRTLKDACVTYDNSIPFHDFLHKLLLTLRTARPSGDRPFSPDVMMYGRRLRHPLTMVETVGEPLWLRDRKDAELSKVSFLMQQGSNTAIVKVEESNRLRLAHVNQLSPRKEEVKSTIVEKDETETEMNHNLDLTEPRCLRPRSEAFRTDY